MKPAPSKKTNGTTKSAMRLYSRGYKRLYLNASERLKLFENAQTVEMDIRFLCFVLLYTGCRISEALNITVNDVQWGEGIIAIRSLKKRDLRHVRELPLPQWMLDEIYQALVINASKQGHHRILDQSRTTAWRQVTSLMRQCGIHGIHATPRGLRHSFGVHCAMNNIPMPLAQKWMGHSSLKVTAIYYQIVGPEERQLAKRMW